MNNHQFNAEFTTAVYVNGNGSVTICQSSSDGSCNYVIIGSKARAIEIARAIREVATLCSFDCEEIGREEP